MTPQDRPPYERLERYELGPEQRLVTTDPTRLRRGIAIGLLLEVIVIGLAVLGAWLLLSGLQDDAATMSEAPPGAWVDLVDGRAAAEPEWPAGGASPPSVAASAVPSGGIGTVLYSGTATWYCGQGSPCTRGYGPLDMVAAIDPTLGIAKGERVRVTHDGKSVTVRIVDVCACAGSRLIDLTSGAFLRLASTDLGVIPVTLETVGATRTLPPTSTAP